MQAEPSTDIHLLFYLPSFPAAVLYSQPHMPLPQALDDASTISANAASTNEFVPIFDPEVARSAAGQENNPCEVKALRLSQASGSAGVDRCARLLPLPLLWNGLHITCTKRLCSTSGTLPLQQGIAAEVCYHTIILTPIDTLQRAVGHVTRMCPRLMPLLANVLHCVYADVGSGMPSQTKMSSRCSKPSQPCRLAGHSTFCRRHK